MEEERLESPKDRRWPMGNSRDDMLHDGGGIQERGKRKCLMAQVIEDPKGMRAGRPIRRMLKTIMLIFVLNFIYLICCDDVNYEIAYVICYFSYLFCVHVI
jgi:hypothetical protein